MKHLLTNLPNPLHGRIIVQPDCPPEVEISGHKDYDTLEIRLQYHTIKGMKPSADDIEMKTLNVANRQYELRAQVGSLRGRQLHFF